MESYRNPVLTAAVSVPLVVCAGLVPFRHSFDSANAALLLVLVIVAVASFGVRPAGVVAAVSSAVWFDFFLTVPFNRLTIESQDDIEATILHPARGDRYRSDRDRDFLAGGKRDHAPQLNPDGSVTREDRLIKVERDGLPTDSGIELVVQHAGIVRGRFLLPASRIARPDLEQRLVAVALADRVGGALASQESTLRKP